MHSYYTLWIIKTVHRFQHNLVHDLVFEMLIDIIVSNTTKYCTCARSIINRPLDSQDTFLHMYNILPYCTEISVVRDLSDPAKAKHNFLKTHGHADKSTIIHNTHLYMSKINHYTREDLVQKVISRIVHTTTNNKETQFLLCQVIKTIILGKIQIDTLQLHTTYGRNSRPCCIRLADPVVNGWVEFIPTVLITDKTSPGTSSGSSIVSHCGCVESIVPQYNTPNTTVVTTWILILQWTDISQKISISCW